MKSLPGDLFVDLLCFLAASWTRFSGHVKNTSSLKYIVSSNNIDLESVSNSTKHTIICLPLEESHLPWLEKWSVIFGNDVKYYSIHEYTQKEIIDLNRHT